MTQRFRSRSSTVHGHARKQLGRCFSIAIPCVLWTMLLGKMACGAPPKSLPASMTRIDIPADRPSEWPRAVRQSVAVPLAEFERLLKAASLGEQGPRRVRITSARYSATLAGTSLREGQLKWNVQRVGADPALHPLGELSFALQNLMWSDRPAVWGSDANGTSWLLADQPQGELSATWSSAGRSLPNEIDFDVTFPSAAVSTFDLKVPRDRIVRAVPEARRVTDGSDAEWQVWRMELGSERRCRLAISQQGNSVSRQPTILYEHELAAVVREEDVRFQTLMQLEVFDAPVSQLTLTVPASVEVYAVTYGGDLPLTWSRSDRAEAGGTLTVQLPGPVTGRIRPIRIDGLAVHKPGQPTVSPQIDIKGGVFAGGRQLLTIVAPIQLRSVRSNGFRQQGTVSPSAEGEVFAFRQMVPNAQLILDVQRPRASLAAQVLGWIETGDDSWTLTSELHWTSSSGGVFQTTCLFPADWEITDVQFVSKQRGARLAGWDVQPQSGGLSLLSVEFLEAIEPGRPHTVRVLARRRAIPVGQSFGIPVPLPRDCDSVETTLGLAMPAGLSPLLSDDARLERGSQPEDSVVDSLRRRPRHRSRSEFWFRGDTPESVGSMQLVSRLRPVTAKASVMVEAAPAEYRERFQVRCRADGAPLDRLLVYLTQPGTEIRWSVLLPRPGELTAIRLPTSQHSDWNCPATGELWELRLPPLPAGPIEIEGARSSRWSPMAHPSLLFVPQSTDRQGLIQLRRPDSLELTVDATGLDTPTATNGDAPLPPPTDDSAPSLVTTVWRFDAFEDELSIALRDPIPSREYPAMVTLQLRSLISSNADGFDLYRARIRLENGSASETLRIRLPAPAVLQEATVAGEAIVPTTQGEELLVPGVNAARRDIVELLYRVPAHSHIVRDERRVIVPIVAATVLGFEWEFALPPSVRLFSEPAGVRLMRPLSRSSWTERLFGPLGRSREERLFNPFALESWRELLHPVEPLPASIGEVNSELIAPVEWHVHTAASASVPDTLTLVTWHSTRTRLLSWIALGVAMSAGIVLRIAGWRYRDRMAAYLLAVLSGISICGASPYAEVAGGAIAGSIVALLIPRRTLLFPRRPIISTIPTGSTQSFTYGRAVGTGLGVVALTLAGCWLSLALAQETTSPEKRVNGGTSRPMEVPQVPQSVEAAAAFESKTPPADNRSTVFVPVDDDGAPSRTLSLVYVSPELLVKLREAALAASPLPKWLIGSANYRASVGAQGSVSLLSRFRVHVPDGSAERELVIPIPDAVLAGAEACRLNGKPHPVTMAPDGKGFVVTLPSTLQGESANEPPRAATFDVELDLKRVGSRTSKGGGFSATIPKVAETTWSVDLADATEFLEVIGGRGASTRTADRRGIETQCGSTSHIEVRWSQAAPETKPSQLEVSMLQVLELRPSFGELRFRAKCEPLDGTFDFVEFDLPANSLLREGDIRSPNLLRAEFISSAADARRLRVTFTEPRREQFEVEGTILIPVSDPSVSMPLPRYGVVAQTGQRVLVVQNWWWVGAGLEYRVETQNLSAELGGGVSAAEFLEAWGDVPPTSRPTAVFQLREGDVPQFSLSPQVARRRAVRWQQSGRVGKRRLEWKLDATIEVTQAPVHQHVLFVDRRVQIESISVQENGAERLIRWSEARPTASPTRVVLFLRDKSLGVQQVTLKGSMPLRQGAAVPLPFVKCEEAELVDARWELVRDLEFDVDLILPRGVPPFESEPDAAADEGPKLVARYQIADPDPKTSIRVSSRHAPCSARTAVVLTKSDARGWLMQGQIWLTPMGESPRRLGIRFPANGVDPSRVRIEQAEGAWHDPVDGWRRLDLLLPPEPTEVSVSYNVVLEEPTRGDWDIPWPSPLQATSHSMCLVTAPADVWTPLIGTELKPDEAPGWADEFLDERMPESASAMYRLASAPVRLRRHVSVTQFDEPLVRLLDHSLWLTETGGRHGLTRAFLSHVRDEIEFQVPEGLQPVALFIDDRPLPLPSVSAGLLRVPLVGGGRESVLTFVWNQTQPARDRYSRAEWETLPWPSQLKVSRSLSSVVPYRNGLLVSRTRSELIGWMAAAFDRLDMLLDRQFSLDNDPRAAAMNREMIDELQARVASRLPAHTTSSSKELTRQLERWNNIVESINGLGRPALAEKVAPVDRPFSSLDAFVDHPQLLRTAPTIEEPRVGFWLFDQRWLSVLCAMVLSLFLVSSLRRLIRLDWGEWLSARATISWVLLGVMWWLYLTPGFLGPMIIAAAVVRALVQRTHRIELNSTLGSE